MEEIIKEENEGKPKREPNPLSSVEDFLHDHTDEPELGNGTEEEFWNHI